MVGGGGRGELALIHSPTLRKRSEKNSLGGVIVSLVVCLNVVLTLISKFVRSGQRARIVSLDGADSVQEVLYLYSESIKSST